jgi:hypothetical protein
MSKQRNSASAQSVQTSGGMAQVDHTERMGDSPPTAQTGEVQLEELVPVMALQPPLSNVFPTAGALEWNFRQHKREYLDGGALFQVGQRLMAHPATFKRIALAIAARKAREHLGIGTV